MSLFIISELGINHNGKFENIEEMIRQSKLGNANAVKLQLYSSQKLFGDDSRKQYEISFDQLKTIKSICEYYNIEVFASVFDEERLEWTEKLDFKYYKIASRTYLKDYYFVEKIINIGKPTFISLGMDKYIHFNNDNVKYFRCIPKYPTSFMDISKYDFKFDKLVCGYSDHGYGISQALFAISQGARIIEKHFTLNKLDNIHRDHLSSMDLEELKILSSIGNEIYNLRNKIS